MKTETVWSRLNWPQVAALGVTLGAAALFGVFAPIDWATIPWEALISGATAIAGIIYGATKDRVVARSSLPPPPFAPSRPRRIPPPKREGSVDQVALVWVLAFCLAFYAALHARGAL